MPPIICAEGSCKISRFPTINTSAPERLDPTEMFYFYEAYFRKCHDAKSNKTLSTLPGSVYFLREKEKEHFVRYNNGFECETREGPCRCPYEVKGMPAPLPDEESLSAGQGFHYFKRGTQEPNVMKRKDKGMISIQ